MIIDKHIGFFFYQKYFAKKIKSPFPTPSTPKASRARPRYKISL